MLSTLSVSTINDGSFKTQIKSKKDSLNEEDYLRIEQILSSNSIKKDGTIILSSHSIENVVKDLEKSGFYFLEHVDQQTHIHQLTPNNWAQGKDPQLRQ